MSKDQIDNSFQPGNIFLRDDCSSSTPSVLLGDFGLACLHETKLICAASSPGREDIITHSTGVGTSPYAAPEQQSSAVYNNAVINFHPFLDV